MLLPLWTDDTSEGGSTARGKAVCACAVADGGFTYREAATCGRVVGS